MSTTHPSRDGAPPAWAGPVVVAVLLGVGLLSLLSLRPPAPRPAAAPDSAFSAERARVHLDRIAGAPRPLGSPAHGEAREYLVDELRALGLEVTAEPAVWTVGRSWWIRAVAVRNIVARLPGTDPTGTLALMSHYDSQMGAPGAGDAGAAVAAILEAVRALRAGPPLRNDLVVLLTDAEEMGLIGARQFLHADTTADSVTIALNLEGRGTRGPSLMFETGQGNGPLVRLFARADPRPIGSSLLPEAYAYLPNTTDFTAFLAAGRTGLNFAHASGADAYHMPFDTPDRVPGGTLQHHGDHAVSMVRALGDADLTTIRGDDVTYFNLPGVGLVVYPVSWALPLALAALALMLGLLVWGRRRGAVTLGGVAAGAGVIVPIAALAALAGWGVWRLAAAVHPEAGTLIGQRLYQEVPYMAAVLAMGIALALAAYQLLRRWFGVPSLALGAQALPVGSGLAAAAVVPGTAFLLTWPAFSGLAATAYLIARAGGGGRAAMRWTDLAALSALAIPAILLVAPHYPLFLVGLSIMFAALFAPLTLLVVTPVLPLLQPLSRPNRWWLPGLAAAVAVLFMASGLVRAGVDEARPGAANLVYLLDRDTGQAWWATAHPAGDAWLDRFVGSDAGELEIADFFPLHGQRLYRAAPATPAALAEGAIEVVPREGSTDRVRLGIRPPPGATTMLVTAADTGWVPVGLEGEPLLVYPDRWRIELLGEPGDGAWSLDLLAILPDVEPGGVSIVTVWPGLPVHDGRPVTRPGDRTGTGVLGSRRALTDLTITRQTLRP